MLITDKYSTSAPLLVGAGVIRVVVTQPLFITICVSYSAPHVPVRSTCRRCSARNRFYAAGRGEGRDQPGIVWRERILSKIHYNEPNCIHQIRCWRSSCGNFLSILETAARIKDLLISPFSLLTRLIHFDGKYLLNIPKI